MFRKLIFLIQFFFWIKSLNSNLFNVRLGKMGCAIFTSFSNSSPTKIKKGAELNFETEVPLDKRWQCWCKIYQSETYAWWSQPKNYQLAPFFFFFYLSSFHIDASLKPTTQFINIVTYKFWSAIWRAFRIIGLHMRRNKIFATVCKLLVDHFHISVWSSTWNIKNDFCRVFLTFPSAKPTLLTAWLYG